MGWSRNEFDRTLDVIEAKVIELFAMVDEDLPRATAALLSGQRDAVRVLAEREQIIDALNVEIEDLAGREILLQSPVACDLRLLLSVLRIVPELERAHDLVLQIASRAGHIPSGEVSPGSRGPVERMGRLASGMWCQAAEAWYERDRSAASVLDDRDEEMGRLRTSLTAELASGQMPLPVTIDMTLVGHCYVRLGAHAVNIARRVVYLADPAVG